MIILAPVLLVFSIWYGVKLRSYKKATLRRFNDADLGKRVYGDIQFWENVGTVTFLIAFFFWPLFVVVIGITIHILLLKKWFNSFDPKTRVHGKWAYEGK